MELDLSLGASNQLGLGLNNILSIGGPVLITKQSDHHHQQKQEEEEETAKQKHKHNSHRSTTELEDHEYHISPPLMKANNNALVQLDLLPHTPPIAPNLSFPWHYPPLEKASWSCSRGLDVIRLPAAVAIEVEEVAALSSPPNSAASSFERDLFIYSNSTTRGGSVNGEGYDQRGCSSRASDEDENLGSTRKKLRLSKEQSTFLEDSFKEHNTLNPKQKLALAKQLHLRPRQVEVWFQNRRARSKLKQTEVEFEYLKRCCETLTEENRKLHKELQELRTLKTPNPFYTQLPATTLTMCPSCERVATNSTTTSSATALPIQPLPLSKPLNMNQQPPKPLDSHLANPGFIHLFTPNHIPTNPQYLQF